MNMQGRVSRKKRQSHQQTGDQLRAAFAGNACFAGKQRTLDGQRHVDFRCRVERPQDRSKAGHDLGRAFQRSGREGADAVDLYRLSFSESGDDRDHEPGQKAGFADIQFVRHVDRGTCAFDCQRGSGRRVCRRVRQIRPHAGRFDPDLGSECLGDFDGRLVVSARGVAFKSGFSIGEGGGDDGALGETL